MHQTQPTPSLLSSQEPFDNHHPIGPTASFLPPLHQHQPQPPPRPDAPAVGGASSTVGSDLAAALPTHDILFHPFLDPEMLDFFPHGQVMDFTASYGGADDRGLDGISPSLSNLDFLDAWDPSSAFAPSAVTLGDARDEGEPLPSRTPTTGPGFASPNDSSCASNSGSVAAAVPATSGHLVERRPEPVAPFVS